MEIVIRIVLAIIFFPITLLAILGIGLWTFLDIVIAGESFKDSLLGDIINKKF